jgi:invasion protein IalB
MEGAAKMSERPVLMSIRSFFPALVLITGLVAPALAQTDKPSSGDQATPHLTAKAFGSWTLHCQAAHEEGAEPLCALAQTIETSSNKIIAVISIGRRHLSDPVNIIVSLPVNVSFPSTVHIRTDKDDKWGLELQWQRCIPGACIAGGELNPSAIVHWSSLQTDGKIVFQDAAGDEVGVPMSLRGFGDGYNAFNR